MGADWDPSPEEGSFELTIRRKHPGDYGTQPAFLTFPDLSEWRTRDLFRPHPTLKDHWLYNGRADNIIVFSNGEKLNPVTMEEIIVGHPALKGVLVFGQGRFQPGLILEAHVTPQEDAAREALIDQVWPLIEHANKKTVAHGHVAREMIMLADAEKPFLRAGKGTVQRTATLRLYEHSIDSIYEKFGLAQTKDYVPLDISSEQALTQSIIDLLTTKIGVKWLDPDTDFFSVGVDSLQVIATANLLRSSFEAAGVHVDPKVAENQIGRAHV